MMKYLLLLIINFQSYAQLKAFPEAEGFGAFASGGRNGNVLKVTTLSASGVGSLLWAVEQPGARIIVFDVSGIITADIEILHGDITIAGQTAPGAGITLVGHLTTEFGVETNNIIIRHIRVRPPNPNAQWMPDQHDGIQFSSANNIILDHVDVSHGADENIDMWDGANHITIQWSNISFPIYDEVNGWTHNKGILNHRPCVDNNTCNSGSRTGGFISIHHNYFAHARNRTPALSMGPADTINNLIYNGVEGFVHHNVIADGQFNIIGNKYIDGPNEDLAPFWFDPENTFIGNTPPINTQYWLEDNLIEDNGYNGVVNNPWNDTAFQNEYSFVCCGIVQSQFNQIGQFDFTAQDSVPITTHNSSEIEDLLIAQVGAFPRDIVARKSITDLETRTGQWGNYRPDLTDGLTATSPLTDTDGDGMPDSWELQNGLNPSVADNNSSMPSGYTAIEDYINGLATQLFVDNGIIFENGFEN